VIGAPSPPAPDGSAVQPRQDGELPLGRSRPRRSSFNPRPFAPVPWVGFTSIR